MNLRELRKKIDGLDKKIISLLDQRTRIALEIGRVKAKTKKGVYAPDREKEVYKKAVSLNKGILPDKTIKAIYREIMSGALSLEKSMKVAYLGPAATFTHQASLKKFGSSVAHVPVKSITDVFLEVERGRCDYGVVPIENSVEGAVNHTLDMFVDSDLKICSEIKLEISHTLLAKCRMKDIKKIYSKAEVFGQCRIWLETKLPKVELQEVSSTSRAATLAGKHKNTAAIASILAADLYGLKTLARSIEDSSHNMTRFLIIGRDSAPRTGEDKTSIMISLKDKVGALHDMLQSFKRHGVNLTKIESRPSKKKAWEYYFFVDALGHFEDASLKKALKSLEKQSPYLKVLGSYPRIDI